MKTKLIYLFVFLSALAFILSSCSSRDNRNIISGQVTTGNKTKTGDFYTCKVHPQAISVKPEKCPICGLYPIKIELKVNKKDIKTDIREMMNVMYN